MFLTYEASLLRRWGQGVRLLFLPNLLVIPAFLRSDLGRSTFLMTLEIGALSEGWLLLSPTFPFLVSLKTPPNLLVRDRGGPNTSFYYILHDCEAIELIYL